MLDALPTVLYVKPSLHHFIQQKDVQFTAVLTWLLLSSPTSLLYGTFQYITVRWTEPELSYIRGERKARLKKSMGFSHLQFCLNLALFQNITFWKVPLQKAAQFHKITLLNITGYCHPLVCLGIIRGASTSASPSVFWMLILLLKGFPPNTVFNFPHLFYSLSDSLHKLINLLAKFNRFGS